MTSLTPELTMDPPRKNQVMTGGCFPSITQTVSLLTSQLHTCRPTPSQKQCVMGVLNFKKNSLILQIQFRQIQLYRNM